MKNIWLYLLMSFFAIGASSCKDEDDDIITGDGGSLAGVWLAEVSGDDEAGSSNQGLLISNDGKIERIKLDGSSYQLMSDRTEAIITSIGNNTLGLTGVKGNGNGEYSLSESISIEDGKYTRVPRMYLSSNMVQGTSANNYYVKLKNLNPDMTTSQMEHDPQLFGEWTQSFGSNTYSISATSMSVNGAKVSDWCTSNGKLYLLTSYNGLLMNSEYAYSISNGKLKIGTNEYVKKGNEIKGNAGELAGLWLKSTSDYKYYQDANKMYGLMVDANGSVTNPRVSTELSIDNSNTKNELIITSAKNGEFTAVSKAGANVTGKYKIDTVMVFMTNAYYKLEHLQITSSTYNFNLSTGTSSSTTFTGHYVHILDKNGEYCDMNAIDADLVGTWKSSFDDGVETFTFTKEGTLTISTKFYDGSSRLLAFKWGTDIKGYKLYLRDFDDSGEYMYEYFISDNTFYFKDNNGIWCMYDRQ